MARENLGVSAFRRDYQWDALTELQDAVTIATSVVGKVGGSAKVLDIGKARVDGIVICDVTELEIASNDEVYTIIVEGANEVAMDTTLVKLAEIQLGALEVLGPGASRYKVDSVIGRHEIPFSNELGGTVYEYIRIYTIVAGTVATGIKFRAFLAKMHGLHG